MTTTASTILDATTKIRSSATSIADRLQALVEYIGSADFDPRGAEDSDEGASLMDELDSITAETRSELSRGAKALDMLFELFPGATDPAPADGDEDDNEEAPDTFNSIKRARAKLLAQRAEIDATPASGKRTRRARA